MSNAIYSIISREEASKQGLKYYFTDKPCKHGHISLRRVCNQSCTECDRMYRTLHSEKILSQSKQYYNNNRDREVIRNREYRKTYRDKSLANSKRYREANKEKILIQSRQYYRNNLEKYKEYITNNKEKIKNNKQYRRSIDNLYKLKCVLRSLIGNSIRRGNFNKTSRTAQILGCSFEEFKVHIENQFLEGMNWNNHGEWHLDHIYPVSKATNETHMIELNHYTNFQPLWAKDNIRKGNKILY